MYVLSTGCQWRYVPKDLPPKSTLFGYFDLLELGRHADRIHHALYVNVAKPWTVKRAHGLVIDSQSGRKSAEKGGAASIRAAYGCGQIKIKKEAPYPRRYVQACCFCCLVHPADIKIVTGGVLVLSTLFFVSVFAKALC